MFAGDVNSSSQRAKLQTVFLLLSAISLIYYSLHLSDTRIWFIDGKEPNSRLKLPDFRGLGNQCEQLFSLNSSEKLVNESISISGHAFNLRYNENGSFPACGDYFIQREGFLHRGTVTDLERSLPVAFSILVYHNFDQVEQLLLALYRKHNFYCLHVDKKAASDFKKKVNNLEIPISSLYQVNNPSPQSGLRGLSSLGSSWTNFPYFLFQPVRNE